MSDLEQRLDAVCESMESAAAEYNQSTRCLVEALQGIHERLERIEKWIENAERQAVNR
jgi:tetrahydromethanopterin S-methyltransferase subunit G